MSRKWETVQDFFKWEIVQDTEKAWKSHASGRGAIGEVRHAVTFGSTPSWLINILLRQGYNETTTTIAPANGFFRQERHL